MIKEHNGKMYKLSPCVIEDDCEGCAFSFQHCIEPELSWTGACVKKDEWKIWREVDGTNKGD